MSLPSPGAFSQRVVDRAATVLESHRLNRRSLLSALAIGALSPTFCIAFAAVLMFFDQRQQRQLVVLQFLRRRQHF